MRRAEVREGPGHGGDDAGAGVLAQAAALQERPGGLVEPKDVRGGHGAVGRGVHLLQRCHCYLVECTYQYRLAWFFVAGRMVAP